MPAYRVVGYETVETETVEEIEAENCNEAVDFAQNTLGLRNISVRRAD